MAKQRNHGLVKRIAIDIAGFTMIIASPFLGWLPGPGGVPLFLAGLGVLSLNYEWPERILKSFDRTRKELTAKYLVNNPRVSLSVDLVSGLLITTGVYLIITSASTPPRLIGVGLFTAGIVLLFSNRNRLQSWLNKHKKNKK